MTNTTPAYAEERKRQATIDKLKREIARQIRHYREQTAHLDCGAGLATYFKPELGQTVTFINGLAAELRAIDPNFPKGWTDF